MTPNVSEEKTIPIQKQLFDLSTMTNVTCFKEVQFRPVSTTQEALERLGHDAKRLITVINEGLEGEAARTARADSTIPWMVENDEEEKVPFEGIPADQKAVNGLVLNLAKSVFGYKKESTPEEKSLAKQKALDMIKNTDAIREGLKENAAA